MNALNLFSVDIKQKIFWSNKQGTVTYQLDSGGDLKALKHPLEAGVVEAAEGSSQAGHGHDRGPLLAEGVLGGSQGAEGLGVLPDGLQFEALVQGDGPQQVVEDAVGRDGRQVPLQHVQDDHLPLLQK